MTTPDFKPEAQLIYLGKFISYRFKDPILDAAYGVKQALVAGVLVTLPGLDDSTELLISVPGENEPDFICTSTIEILSMSV